MKPLITIFAIFYCLLISCYEPYYPDVIAEKKILVVNGLITNEKIPYSIILSYASSFDTTSTGKPVSLARVSVTDNAGKSYYFFESGEGQYKSDPVLFTARPGNTYILHIATREGIEYVSSPQLMLPASSPTSIYAQFDNKETLSKITGLKELSHGASVLTDIDNQTSTIPRFRFTSNLVTQYSYEICPVMQACYYFRCWQTSIANPDIDLTGGDYTGNSASINRHPVCFIDDYPSCNSVVYAIGPQLPDMSYKPLVTTEYQQYLIHNRIIYLNQYSLNNEAYSYYKSMNEQLQSDGKLFDPIAVQITGNIKCISNTQLRAFGFFEASSVSNNAYTIDFRNLNNGQPSIKKVQYLLPPEPKGCTINIQPLFWVN